MSHQDDFELPTISLEDIQNISRLFAETIAKDQRMLSEISTVVIPEEQITRVINLDAISSSVHGITDILGQISDWFRSILSSVSGWIVNSITSYVSTVRDALLGSIGGLWTSIQSSFGAIVSDIVGKLGSFSSYIITSLQSAFTVAISSLTTTVSGIVPSLSSIFSGIASGITSAITSFSTSIMTSIHSTTVMLSSAISGVTSLISGITASLNSAIASFSSSILHSLSGLGASLINTFSSVASSIYGFISNLSSSIINTLTTTARSLANTISGVVPMISNVITVAISSVVPSITNFFGTIAKSIMDSMSGLGKSILDFFNNIGSQILSGIQKVNEAFSAFGRQMAEGFSGMGKWFQDLLNFLVSSFTDMASKVGIGFETLSTTLMGFVNSILRLPELLVSGFQKMGEWIWNALPDWLKNTLQSIGRFFTDDVISLFTKVLPPFITMLSKGLTDFISDPWGTLRKISASIWEGLKWIGERVWEGLQFFGELLWKGVETLWNLSKTGLEWLTKTVFNFGIGLSKTFYDAVTGVVQAIGSTITATVKGFVKWALDTAYSVASDVGDIITTLAVKLVSPMGETVGKAVEKPFQELVTKLSKGERTRGEWIELGWFASLYWASLIASQALAYGCWVSLHGLGMIFNRFEWKTPIRIRLRGRGRATPAGVGADAGADAETGSETNVTINLGLMFRHLAGEIRKHGDTFARSLVYGLGIWMSQPIMRLASSAFRDVLVIELPDIGIMTEITRRHMPTDNFITILEKYREFLRLYGYRSEIINWLTSTEDFIEVYDRFNKTRKIPISLIYELPSASDVATMMVRDIFASIDDFTTLYQARGMTKDIGALYYFLRFKYPPPERLWEFTMRGVSGLLWSKHTRYLLESATKEAKELGAYAPIDASELNFKFNDLLSAFQAYMKWHDYAIISWRDRFTSDNQIIMDTLADIPTKIDQRWMVKWGIYEYLKSKGVTRESTVKDFVKIVEGTPASGAIQLDLSNFCRTLQATGLHPYWVPITAVAETINVLTEERTLLRSGVQGLFKEGFIDSKSLESLLSEAIVVSYKVSYFDIDSMNWVDGYINMPLGFLPAERGLITLRAHIDRAMDILKEIQRDVSNAYQDAIISTKQEYIDALSKVINNVSKTMPTPIKLNLVREYYDIYIDALNIYREVYTVRRIRSWTMRWLGWIMYRVATGLVTDEELNRLVETLVSYSKLTDVERQFFTDVFQTMKGIAMREYAPSPSQLATLAEYITIPEELIQKSFEVKMITPEWRDIWRQYIRIRPIVDDVKALITTYRRALLYAKIPPETEKQILALAQEIGYTEREMTILGLRVQLDELIMASKEFLPSPSTLATLSEYVTLPEGLIRKALEARRVPPEWIGIWLTYVRTKPIKSDVKSLLSVYIRALRYKAVTKDEVEAFIKTLPQYGFSQDEINFIVKRVQLEEAIMTATTTEESYIPTLTTLVTFSEYMTIPDDVIKSVFEARGVPTEWQNFWMRYIRVKPLADDIRGLSSTYRRALLYISIPDDIRKKVEEYANLIGFTQVEWDILNLRTQLEEMIANSREYIPTPSMLASLVEYVPEAREFFKEVMIARRVPERWQTIWAKYIDIRPLVDDIKRYLSRAEALYVRFMLKRADFEKVLAEVADYLGYTQKETEFLMKITDYERYRNAWTELIGTVDRLVELSEYSPRASKFAIAKVNEMIDALPLLPADKQELKTMWEEYIRNRPVKSEAKLYVTQLINAYVEGLITQADFYRELDNMKKWGFSDTEVEFYKAQAEVRRARKLKIPLVYGE